jgi:hypothetical protein
VGEAECVRRERGRVGRVVVGLHGGWVEACDMRVGAYADRCVFVLCELTRFTNVVHVVSESCQLLVRFIMSHD